MLFLGQDFDPPAPSKTNRVDSAGGSQTKTKQLRHAEAASPCFERENALKWTDNLDEVSAN